MIIRPRPPLWQLFFILRGSVVPRIWPQFTVVFLISAAVVYAHRSLPDYVPVFDGAPFTLIGIALSIFLGFRNDAAYKRWWEGRSLWGQQIQLARTFARQTLLVSEREDRDAQATRRKLLELTAAFSYAMVAQLRSGDFGEKCEHLLAEEERRKFVERQQHPTTILEFISRELVRLRQCASLTDIEFQLLDGTVQGMEAVLAGCERLRTTPIPFGYTLLLHRTAYLFCFLLPFGYADLLSWGTHLLRP